MLLHVSLTVVDPAHVARVVAELLDATVVDPPVPPFPSGSKYVCCFDEPGTMLELLPAGTAYALGPGHAPRATAAAGAPASAACGVHALVASPRSAAEIAAIAAREGWPCGVVDTGLFAVVAVWLEGRQLLELTTPELMPAYRALYGAAGRDVLDGAMRGVEVQLRAMLARGAAH
jgi:hypothetical protein